MPNVLCNGYKNKLLKATKNYPAVQFFGTRAWGSRGKWQCTILEGSLCDKFKEHWIQNEIVFVKMKKEGSFWKPVDIEMSGKNRKYYLVIQENEYMKQRIQELEMENADLISALHKE